jgi:hypothetical protein
MASDSGLDHCKGLALAALIALEMDKLDREVELANRISGPLRAKETLENPAILRENGAVISGVDWLHGHQAVWFW